MSTHVLLSELGKSDKSDKCEACRAIYRFFAMSLINSIIEMHEC